MIIILVIIIFSLSGCVKKIDNTVTDPSKGKTALNIALKQKGTQYVWGGRGPDVFDCSGLITYSYKEAYEHDKIFNINSWINDDATIQGLYNWNVKYLSFSKIKPGDIIFMTRTDGEVTHGGLFIEWIKKYDKFKFVHASSYSGKVVVDTWYINQMDRVLSFVKAGRFKASLNY